MASALTIGIPTTELEHIPTPLLVRFIDTVNGARMGLGGWTSFARLVFGEGD
jgi:hypothetical protein